MLIQFIDSNSWLTFTGETKGIPDNTTNLVIYKSVLIAVGHKDDQLVMAILNLESNSLNIPF